MPLYDDLSEPAARALEIYEAQLGPFLEKEHSGKGIAIHPATGDYALGETTTQASRILRERHPDAQVVTLTIGESVDYTLLQRTVVIGGHR